MNGRFSGDRSRVRSDARPESTKALGKATREAAREARRGRRSSQSRLRRRTVILSLVVPLIVLPGMLVLFAGRLLRPVSNRIKSAIPQYAQQAGTVVDGITSRDPELALPNGVRWRFVSVAMEPKADGIVFDRSRYLFWFESLTIRVRDLSFQRFIIEGQNLTVTLLPVRASSNADPARTGPGSLQAAAHEARLAAATVRIPIVVTSFERAREDLLAQARELVTLLRTGESAMPVVLEGSLNLTVRGSPFDLRLMTVPTENGTAVVLDVEDLRKVAALYSSTLTATEMALIARSPRKAPWLLRLKEDAEKISHNAAATDPTVPEDAYRHVLWSYLLTKHFGPEYAERVTNAHEAGIDTGSENDHRMDYHNNKVGRSYAVRGIPEEQVLQMVRQDPDVFRDFW